MYTLDNIINEVIIEGGGNKNLYARYYQYGTSVLRELQMDVSGSMKSIELPLGTANEVEFPDDFIDYVSISIVSSNGLLLGLGLNTQLNTTNYFDSCGVPVSHNPNINTSITQNFNYNANWNLGHVRNGEYLGRNFNAGGHNLVGGYRVDYGQRKFIISPTSFNIGFIVLEYLPDLNSANGDYIVHPYLIETIKAWIYWKSIQRDRNFSLGEKQMAEFAYNKALRWAIGRFSSATLQEWKDAIAKGNKATPKWGV